jgi:hypothetical protein
MLPPHTSAPFVTPYYIPNSLFFNLIFRFPLIDFVRFLSFTRRTPKAQNLLFGLPLIRYIIIRMEAMDRWVKVGTVENRFEGDRISQTLQEAGISFLIKSFLDTAYDGLYIPQKGWGVVMVPKKNSEVAERLISEVKKTFVKEEGDETGQRG